MLQFIAIGIIVTIVLFRFVATRSRLPRNEAFIDFTPLRDANGFEPDFTARIRNELERSGSVQRAYLVISTLNNNADVLTLGLRFYGDAMDEALLRRLDAVNVESSAGKRLIAMLPLSDFDERQTAKVAHPIFDASGKGNPIALNSVRYFARSRDF